MKLFNADDRMYNYFFVQLLNKSFVDDRINFFCVKNLFLHTMAVACLKFEHNSFQKTMNQKDIRLDLLCKIEKNPQYTQRELSREMGVSLGKVNYCLKQLTAKGLIKISNFKKNPNKFGYVYLLTPKGIEEKARLTFSFLKIKIIEFETLKEEIKKLKEDAGKIDKFF